ncbi:MAG: hypothetical protein Q4C55_04450 [Eubacterium sp.]|nr:hypothetical protein [Eubacterium sp.]
MIARPPVNFPLSVDNFVYNVGKAAEKEISTAVDRKIRCNRNRKREAEASPEIHLVD